MRLQTSSMKRACHVVATIVAVQVLSACVSMRSGLEVEGISSVASWRSDQLAGLESELYEVRLPWIHERPGCTEADVTPANRNTRVTMSVLQIRPEARAGSQSRDVIVYIPGGPGAAGIAHPLTDPSLFSRISRTHDVLVVDPRAAGGSEPYLGAGFEHTVPAEQLSRHIVDMLSQRADEGHVLAAVNTCEAASDIVATIDALGYRRLRIYGISYGTRIAMHIASEHSHRVASLVLDGPVLPGAAILEESPTSAAAALDTFFESVEADTSHNGAFSELREEYFDFRDQLGEGLEFPISFTAFPGVDAFELTPSSLDAFVFHALYSSSAIPYLPRTLTEIFRGNFYYRRALEIVQQQIAESTSNFIVSHYLWWWNDSYRQVDLGRMRELGRGVRQRYPGFFEQSRRFAGIMHAITDSGAISGRPGVPAADIPARVPTLILSGELDPITRLDDARRLQESLPHARLSVLPQGGHGVAWLYASIRDGVISYLEDPQTDIEAVFERFSAPGYLRL